MEQIPIQSKAFQRHVKRFILAPDHRFVAVAPPELALLTQEELKALGVDGETEGSEAGVEFSGPFSSCYAANLHLRTASRILCRLEPFRAGALEELFQKTRRIPWECWISSAVPVRVEAHVEQSRIGHEGRVRETVEAALGKRFQLKDLSAPPVGDHAVADSSGAEPEEAVKQRVLVHLRSNQCRISLDTTGTHLHQRGYRRLHGGAPLRETLAAGILLKCGWKGDVPLVDGMCGAGTFPIEGARLARRLPPGGLRPFLFERWPGFQEKTWEYLRRKAVEGALPRAPVPIVGVDLDPHVLEAARRNGEAAEASNDIRWVEQDFLTFRPQDLGLSPGLVVLNPPYGHRIQGDVERLYVKLGSHLRQAFDGWRVAILLPRRSFLTHLRLSGARLWKISHGGLPVTVAMARL